MRTRKTVPLQIKTLIEQGVIVPEKVNKKDKYPTIGFDKGTKSWYAWNHKVYNYFHIGSRVNVGNCAYTEKHGAWVAKTMDDAKQMAIDFAKGVA